jgi:hypothetical protein
MTSMADTDTNSDTPGTTTHVDLRFHHIFNIFYILRSIPTSRFLEHNRSPLRIVPPPWLIISPSHHLPVVYLFSCLDCRS